MSEVEINVNRLTEVHGGFERARQKLMAARPSLSVDASGSVALTAFRQRVEELADMVDSLAARAESDSRKLYELSIQFMDQDSALAKSYMDSLSSSLNEQAASSGRSAVKNGRE